MKFKLFGCLLMLWTFGTLASAQTASPCGGVQRTLSINWSQFNFNPCHTGYNPYETKLSPSSVGNLSLSWEASWGWTAGQPIVVNGIAYVYSNDGDLRAFTSNSGTLLWKSGPENRSCNVAATPAVANGLVYFGSCDGNLYAVNAVTGTLAWQAPVQAGDGFSPTIANGVVYVSPPAPSQNTYAFDAQTGTLLWTVNTDSPYLPTQPAISNNLVYTAPGNLVALDAKTGTVAWAAGDSYGLVGVPTLSEGRVYVAEGLNYYVSAYNAATGKLLWTQKLDYLISQPITVANGIAYVATDAGSLYFLNAYTGDVVRQVHIHTGDFASAAVANGVVYAGTQDSDNAGTIYAIDAGTGDILWTHRTSVILSGPTVVNGALYVGAAGDLFAFTLPNN